MPDRVFKDLSFLCLVSERALLLDSVVSLDERDASDEVDEEGVDPPGKADENTDRYGSSTTARCSSSIESSNDSGGGNVGFSASAELL